MYTPNDVLKTALTLIQDSQPPWAWSYHGPCCPFCAISQAKTLLDEKYGTGLPFAELLNQYSSAQFRVVASDAPLLEARNLLEQVILQNPLPIDQISREQSILFLHQASNLLSLHH